MKNVAIIFAGGVGSRMGVRSKPKQFLDLHGKAIIVHTLEVFERHPDIDAIVIVCVAGWIQHTRDLLERFHIRKVVDVVAGGETGQLSIYSGLEAAAARFAEDSVVLIHDGVRPLINAETISRNIEGVKACGSAITTAPTTETFVVVDDALVVREVPARNHSRLAKAPQSFVLGDILAAHRQALRDGVSDSIDSCTLMASYGHNLTLVEGPVENIKITTPTDYIVLRAIVDARENDQVFGAGEANA